MTITAAATAYVRPVLGVSDAPILILCDPQSRDAYADRKPMGFHAYKRLTSALEGAGFHSGYVQLVALCPPIPEAAQATAKRTWEFVSAEVHASTQWPMRSEAPEVSSARPSVLTASLLKDEEDAQAAATAAACNPRCLL